jgi:hypothetical protein
MMTKKERIEKKISLAKMPYSRIIFARTPEVNRILNICSQLDKIVSLTKNRLAYKLSAEEVLPKLEELKEIIDKFEEITIKLSKDLDLKYTPSIKEIAEKYADELGLKKN